MFAERPQKCIYNFIGTLTVVRLSEAWLYTHFISLISQQGGGKEKKEEPLGVENTLWANTVLASGWCYLQAAYNTPVIPAHVPAPPPPSIGTALGVVIYTGAETRSVLNTSGLRSKVWYQLMVLVV